MAGSQQGWRGTGGGGGSGSVTSASNLGTGLGVFKAKVLQDLQFRSLLESKGISLAFSLSNDEIEIGLDTDVVGIQDGTGWYTFYSSLALALASAVSGDVITLFSNITQSTNSPITISSDIVINLNGYTYTYSPADTSFAIIGNSGTLKMYNGVVERTNSVQGSFGYNQGGVLNNKATDVFLENVFLVNQGKCVYRNGGRIFGGVIIGGSATFNFSAYNEAGGRCFNTIFYGTEAVYNEPSASLNNCVLVNETNPAPVSNYGILDNCTIFGYDSLLSGGVAQNCSFVDDSNSGTNVVQAINKANVLSCTITSTNTIATQNTIGLNAQSGSVIQNTSVATLGNSSLVLGDECLVTNSSFTIAFSGNTNTPVVIDIQGRGNFLAGNSFNHNKTSNVNSIMTIGENENVISKNVFFQQNKAQFCIEGVGGVWDAQIINNDFLNAITCIDTTTINQTQTMPTDLYGNIQRYP